MSEVIGAGGVRLHVVTQGAGPTVVLIHGLFLGSLAQWYFTLGPALAARHEVVMFDLRGHGRSDRAEAGYDLSTLVEDLRAVIGSRGPVSLVGHSYGGVVALAYARQHPVERLVIVDAPLPGLPRDASLADPDALLAAIPGPAREAALGGGRRARRMLDGLRFLADRSTLLADLDAERALEGLAAVTCPTLLVYGSTSGCREAQSVLASTLPRATSATLTGGHFLPLEAPGPLAELVARFLDAGERQEPGVP